MRPHFLRGIAGEFSRNMKARAVLDPTHAWPILAGRRDDWLMFFYGAVCGTAWACIAFVLWAL